MKSAKPVLKRLTKEGKKTPPMKQCLHTVGVSIQERVGASGKNLSYILILYDEM